MSIRATDTTAIIEEGHERSERGFVLVSVLFVLAFLALSAATAARALQLHLAQARNVVAASEAAAAADAGVSLAILDLAATMGGEPGSARARPMSRLCLMRSGTVLRISQRDEAGRIDLNHAGAPLLEALLRGAGLTAADARRKAAAIADYRDSDHDERAQGAERTAYHALGLAGPKNAAFETVEELTSVAGFDKALAERLQPHLTVHAMLDGVDPAAATPQLMALLGGEDANLAPGLRAVSPGRTFTVRARATLPNGTIAVRSATITFKAPHLIRTRIAVNPSRARPPVSNEARSSLTAADGALDYVVLAWGRGMHAAAENEPGIEAAAGAPPC